MEKKMETTIMGLCGIGLRAQGLVYIGIMDKKTETRFRA